LRNVEIVCRKLIKCVGGGGGAPKGRALSM